LASQLLPLLESKPLHVTCVNNGQGFNYVSLPRLMYIVDLKMKQALSDSHLYVDQLMLPVKDLTGQDVTPTDRTRRTVVVQETIDSLQQRKLRCDEHLDIRRIKLQQLLQLRTCEQDVEKVHSFFYNLTFVKWIRM
jgi:hypothetical protein